MSVFVLMMTVLSQRTIQGDTLRWYDTTTAGYDAIGDGVVLCWGVRFPVDSALAGRTVFSGRVHLFERMDTPGTLFLSKGGSSPDTVLDYNKFLSVGYGFYEVRFSPLYQHFKLGDTIWLWCYQVEGSGQYPATTDSGPAVHGYGDMVSFDRGYTWAELIDYGIDYNWVMELILSPEDVQEKTTPKPPETLKLSPGTGCLYITGYQGLVRVYDPVGRLILSQKVSGRARLAPLSPGVYLVVAGEQSASAVVR